MYMRSLTFALYQAPFECPLLYCESFTLNNIVIISPKMEANKNEPPVSDNKEDFKMPISMSCSAMIVERAAKAFMENDKPSGFQSSASTRTI